MHDKIKCYVVSGFLGAGKTTHLLQKAKEFIKAGKKCAVIVNEISEFGVDNIEYANNGMEVTELFDGCICCSMNAGLHSSVELLLKDFNVDLICIEPSGVADINGVLAILKDCGLRREEIHNVMIVDAMRIDMLIEVIGPLTETGIQNADQVVISKVGLTSAENVEKAYEYIQSWHPGVQIEESQVD